jgi:type I restriction enzyme M protein
MALALNKPKLDNLANEIWKSAERLRGKFKSYEYQSVILPIIVIRRLECVLIDWRARRSAEVLKNRSKLTEKELAKLVKGIELGTAPFSNKTELTLRKVYEEDHALLEENFRAYINGFSQNVDDVTRVTRANEARQADFARQVSVEHDKNMAAGRSAARLIFK